MSNKPLDRLKHHVSGAIARGEKQAIVEQSNAVATKAPAFTPGPWRQIRGQVTGRPYIGTDTGLITRLDIQTSDADAQLIAAAPDMAEALRNIEAWAASPGECTLDVIRACVRRTLAKAGLSSDGASQAGL